MRMRIRETDVIVEDLELVRWKRQEKEKRQGQQGIKCMEKLALLSIVVYLVYDGYTNSQMKKSNIYSLKSRAGKPSSKRLQAAW
jgi:hypothetical protein